MKKNRKPVNVQVVAKNYWVAPDGTVIFAGPTAMATQENEKK